MGRIDSYENELNRHHWSYRPRSYSSASAMSGIVFQVSMLNNLVLELKKVSLNEMMFEF
jgi:hypothetical protein